MGLGTPLSFGFNLLGEFVLWLFESGLLFSILSELYPDSGALDSKSSPPGGGRGIITLLHESSVLSSISASDSSLSDLFSIVTSEVVGLEEVGTKLLFLPCFCFLLFFRSALFSFLIWCFDGLLSSISSAFLRKIGATCFSEIGKLKSKKYSSLWET